MDNEVWRLLLSASRWSVALWIGMLGGLIALWVFEGGAPGGWAIACAFPVVGTLAAWFQTRAVARQGARRRQGPPLRLRWFVICHAGIAMLVGVPVMGVGALLVLGAIVGQSLVR